MTLKFCPPDWAVSGFVMTDIAATAAFGAIVGPGFMIAFALIPASD